jgi:AAA15 family ATPase/GTPase
MLIRFRVANFRSLRDEQELSMVASPREGRDRLDMVRFEELDLDLLRAAAVYGANAAGKSNVLSALRFMRNAVTDSHRLWRPEGPIPREPFLLDDSSRGSASLFEVDLLLEGVRYQYGFKLDAERILEEWLYSYPKKRRQLLFSRDCAAPEPFLFGKNLKGNHRLVQALARENSLFLSVAAANNHQTLLPLYRWFADGLHVASAEDRTDDLSFTLAMLAPEPERRAAVVDLLELADLGIAGLELREERREGMFVFEAAAAPRVLEVKHRTGRGLVSLPLQKESRGTQAWISLTGTILWVLERGALLLLDELDASLHPRLALEVIRIFQDPVRNPRNAQLLLTTHDTTLLGNLLGKPSLHRDQVWFAEKDQDGASHLYPLTDFKPRKLENLERGYLQGRYGAIPFISSQLDPG